MLRQYLISSFSLILEYFPRPTLSSFSLSTLIHSLPSVLHHAPVQVAMLLLDHHDSQFVFLILFHLPLMIIIKFLHHSNLNSHSLGIFRLLLFLTIIHITTIFIFLFISIIFTFFFIFLFFRYFSFLESFLFRRNIISNSSFSF